MEKEHAGQDIEFIKHMICRTREVTAGSWMFLLVWGILCIVAVGGMYALVYIQKFELIMWNWILFMGLGVVFTLFYRRKLEQRSGVKTYATQAAANLSMACGTGFILVGFIFPMMNVYQWAQIPVLIATVAGILMFTMGGIYEWTLLKWCGVIWWLGALAMAFVAPDLRALMFIPLMLIGYIWPALRLRSLYNGKDARHAG